VSHRFISGHRRSILRGHHQRVTVSISMPKLCLARPSSHTCVVSAATGDSRNLLVHALGSSSLIFSDYLPKDWQGAFYVLKQKISRQLIVQDDLLLTVLRRVVQSRCVFSTMIGHLTIISSPRHPKFTYTIGVYPVLRLALSSAPVSLRIAVERLMRWAKVTR
jgi:hypothetical protein